MADATAVAVAREHKGQLRARGAFGRLDLPLQDRKARAGDLLEVRCLSDKAKTVQRLGRPSSVPAVIKALALDAGERPHTPASEREAERLIAAAPAVERRDLRQLPTFTIDGASTRDFDDALSARREGKRIRVWVHVADVAAYVPAGSPLDQEALRRATSVYLPTQTVPMLPEALSNGVCSLLPGADRGAVTCEFLLENGVVVEQSFYRSLIHSDARLTYDHVEEIFLGNAEPGPTYAAALAAARQAAIDRSIERAEFRSEPVFRIGSGGEVSGIDLRSEQESQQLIERLMVLANQQVASFLDSRGVPALYRVHDGVDPERLERALSRLASLGCKPKERTFESALEAAGTDQVLCSLVYASRSPAAYSRELAGHASLGVAAYTHFTSPIRRYSDLVVHRALLTEIGAAPLEQTPRFTQLPEIAEHLNERNRVVRKLSRRAESICRVALLRRRIEKGMSKTTSGRIVGISEYGCYIAVDCAEGMLGQRDIGGQANAEQTMWKTAKGRKLRLGQPVRVKISRLDPVRGRIDLQLA